MVKIVLKDYLEKLNAIEVMKPKGEAKKQVPTISELAKKTGLHRGSLYRIAHQPASALHFKTANSIIKAMREFGFDMQISDLVTYEEDENEA